VGASGCRGAYTQWRIRCGLWNIRGRFDGTFGRSLRHVQLSYWSVTDTRLVECNDVHVVPNGATAGKFTITMKSNREVRP